MTERVKKEYGTNYTNYISIIPIIPINNVNLYHFDHVSSFNKYLSSKVECFNHNCHEFEMYYVFEPNMAAMIDKKINKYGNATWTNNELMLIENIQRLCGNCAIARMTMQPVWKGFHIIKKKCKDDYCLDTESILRISPNYDNNHCQFWDSLGYY